MLFGYEDSDADGEGVGECGGVGGLVGWGGGGGGGMDEWVGEDGGAGWGEEGRELG